MSIVWVGNVILEKSLRDKPKGNTIGITVPLNSKLTADVVELGFYHVLLVDGKSVNYNGWCPGSCLDNVHTEEYNPTPPPTSSGAPQKVVVTNDDGSQWEATQFTQVA